MIISFQVRILIFSRVAGHTAQKMKFSMKDFFTKCDQIRRKLRIWSHLLKISLMENFIFCAVIPILSLNELGEKLQAKFVNKP